MPIRRRSRAADVQSVKKHNLRHPLLKPGSAALMVYRAIEATPGITSKRISDITSSHQPITNMLNEGLIRKFKNKNNQICYEVVPENSTGQGRDRVEVEVVLFVNDFGEYSVNSRMINQRLTAHEDNPRELIRKTFSLYPPRPDEPYAIRPMIDVNELQTFAKPQEADFVKPAQPLTLDGDYRVIGKDDK